MWNENGGILGIRKKENVYVETSNLKYYCRTNIVSKNFKPKTIHVHYSPFQIEDQLEYESDRNCSLTPMNQLLIALRFYATGTFQLVIGDLFKVHKSTACRAVHKVTACIGKLCSKFVKFPSSAHERRDIMNQFFQLSGLPGVIGAIDCTHVPIQSPGGQDAEIYRNRKGYFSINVQLICDCQGFIMDVVASVSFRVVTPGGLRGLSGGAQMKRRCRIFWRPFFTNFCNFQLFPT
jgi:hypothetical protein